MKIITNLKESKNFKIEDLILFCIKELNITDDITITLTQNEKLLKTLSKDVDFEALLYQILPKQYVLYTKNKTISPYVLCHEMVHLHQYEKGDLRMSSDLKQITWKGTTFDNTASYTEREWEIEAFSKQNKLWKNFKKENKKATRKK